MQTHDTNILQEHPVDRDLLDLARRKADDQDAAVPRCAFQARIHQPHGVVHDIHPPAARRERLDAVFPAALLVVDAVVCPKGARHF